jgi:hypothetical protein
MKYFFSFFIVFSLIVSMTSCQSEGQEPNKSSCDYFKIGTFKYAGSEDIRIERTTTSQIEYNLNGNGGYIYTDRYHIEWTGDCEYYLVLDRTDHPNDLDFSITDTMWVKINEVSRTGYSFTAIKGSETFTGELKKTDS